ncbi:thiol reductant ABC exporter subunit CydC [Calidifontibacter sp. DB0510]|uniref:Thiol reductant ABC exporter subunit CydC n=1 Tax=Metallococcus carri TaxID=1656884 RepID=A0A967EBQ5_9MICO|nr:thiol reductant ABC exporter subunit CydC [Metallococcus carri]NHN57214.1 thiol reductant ABC exporter subunit CydC [Metallococcus carri]NOP37983.1 thiol reductant ABC exporter subunit CydC [Calidifontibacter sp. DB2511S]
MKPLLQPARRIVPAGVLGGIAVACGVFLTATSGWLIVQASTRPVILTLLTAVVGVRTFGIGRPVFRYWERVISHDGALRDLAERRTETYRSLIPLTPARLGRRRRADLLTGVVRDLDDEVDVQVRSLVPLIATLVASVLAIVVAFVLLPVAGAVVAVLALCAVALGVVDGALERRGQRDVLAARGEVQRIAHLYAANTVELQAIHAVDDLARQLAEAQAAAERAARRQVLGRAVGLGGSLLLTGLGVGVMAYAVSGPLGAGALAAPVAALLVFLPLALGDVLGLVPDAVGALVRARVARRRLVGLVDQEPAVADVARERLTPAAPTLRLVDATASWTGAAEHLPPTTLTLAPGEKVLVTGANGSGKSTLLALLARQLDPSAGRYEVDGRDVRTVSLAGIRDLMAVVDDDPHLFNGTVRANLLLAQPDATDRELDAALVHAGLGRWLAGLPDGLDTQLGTGVRGLSGGERARFGIARALVSGRPVVLLDEPVAHLDRPTATAVLGDLMASADRRTVVLVSHQPVLTEAFDRVVALDASPAPPLPSSIGGSS